MRYRLVLFSGFLMLSAVLFSQSNAEPAKKSADVRFSPEMLDKTIDPCTDFFAYACSKWRAQNPIPSDRSSWGRFNELQDRGEYIVHDILDKASVDRALR